MNWTRTKPGNYFNWTRPQILIESAGSIKDFTVLHNTVVEVTLLKYVQWFKKNSFISSAEYLKSNLEFLFVLCTTFLELKVNFTQNRFCAFCTTVLRRRHLRNFLRFFFWVSGNCARRSCDNIGEMWSWTCDMPSFCLHLRSIFKCLRS